MLGTTRREFMGITATLAAAAGTVPEGLKGDGVQDETEAIQRAIDKGGLLDLPPGTFRITKPIVFDTARCGYAGIRGSQGTARIVMAGPGPAVHVIGDHQGTAFPASVKPHTWDLERFPVLSGFEIVGDHPEADGIALFRTMKPVITNVLVRRCRYGIHLYERNRNVIIADSHLYDNTDSGLFLDHVNLHQANIIGNHISYNARAGIRQLDGDVHNVQITGNDIEYNSGYADGLTGEIVLEAPGDGIISEMTISSNTIQAVPANPGANIAIVGRDNDFAIGLIAITGNILGSRDRNVFVKGGASELTLTGNTIYTGMDSNIVLERCTNAVIASNTVTASFRNPEECDDRGGVLLDRCTGCVVSGNVVHVHGMKNSPGGALLDLVNCREVTVTGNVFRGADHHGVYVDGCRVCRVTGNTIIAEKEGKILVTPVGISGGRAGNQIKDNFVGKRA